MKRFLTLLVICLIRLLIDNPCFSQTRTGADANVIDKLRAAVEANPDSAKMHQAFRKALYGKDSLLIAQYREWTARFPKSVTVPLSISTYLNERYNSNADEFTLKVVMLKPDYDKGWLSLSAHAKYVANNDALAVEYMKKALIADPKNSTYAFNYADDFKDIDRKKRDSMLLAVAWKYPNTEGGALALNYLANDCANYAEKINTYQLLYTQYQNTANQYFVDGMWNYYYLLLETDPESAVNLALKMNLEPKIAHNWQPHLDIARDFVKAKNYINEHQPAKAAQIFENINTATIPGYERRQINKLIFIQKMIVAAADNQHQKAYSELAKNYAKEPTDKVRQMMFNSASKLGLDSIKVLKQIQKLRDSAAVMATDFSLKNYLTHANVSLKDYRGKVILLTYWFPTCGPCRAEFPHFENALKKVNSKNAIYLGLNSFTAQDDYVSQFIKTAGLSFVPLRDNRKSDKGNLENDNSAPVNFLIDQNGKIVFANFRIDATNERTLELMISETLKQ